MMRRRSLVVLFLVVVSIGISRQSAAGQEASADATAAEKIPAEKQTQLGLYVTAQEAHAKWQADPEKVKILDVRTPEEYAFVGHAEMARNIPLMFMAYEWDAEKNRPVMKRNPEFLTQVKETLKPHDTILVTCRSGQRSKLACDLLSEAGFKKVYNIVDGMEGDAVKDPNLADFGKRTINGWKNAGLPWTYDIDAKLMYLAPKN